MEIAEAVKEKIDYFFEHAGRSLVDTLGIEFISLDLDSVSARMPVDQRTHQPFGILHGGASVALAETIASVGAWLNVCDEEKNVVGLEINAYHLRSVSSGWVYGSGRPIHRGSRTQVWQVDISDEKNLLVCTSRCTMISVPKR